MKFLVVGVVLVLAACSSPAEKEEPAETMDTRCAEVNARFADDLAYGESFGGDGIAKLDKRVALIEDLRDQARDAEEPGQELDGWLKAVDELLADLATLKSDFQNATMGSDMALAMRLSIVDSSVDEVGRAAKAWGYQTCADVEKWKIFPGTA